VEVVLPVVGHAAGGSRYGLIERVVVRWREHRAIENIFRHVVPEPVLLRLVRLDHRVVLGAGVPARML
jgi:hypothetical protein